MSEDEHSIYGASGASRWRTCPGSVDLIKSGIESGQIPKNLSSNYADEGTIAHEWANKILLGEAQLSDVPDKMREHLKGYINICKSIIAKGELLDGFKVYNEAKLPLFYRPEDKGTLDFAVVTVEWIQFLDLKYGAGVEVVATDNDQLAIYGLSLIAQLESEGWIFENDFKIALGIYQPRHFKFNGEPDVWVTTVRDLKDFGIDIKNDYEVALTSKKLKPSNYGCQFCDAKAICVERGKTSFGNLPPTIDIMAEFEDESEKPSPKEITETIKAIRKNLGMLTRPQIDNILTYGSLLQKMVDDVEKWERARLEAGGEIYSHKLVDGGEGNRTWTSEEEAEKLLKPKLGIEQTYVPRKLISAPQALAILEPILPEMSTRFKNRLNELVIRPQAKSKLVPVSDKKPALVFTQAEDDFDDIKPEDDISDLL
jgi:hypothetical protein